MKGVAQVHGSTCADDLTKLAPSILWIFAKSEGFVMLLAVALKTSFITEEINGCTGIFNELQKR